MIISKKIISFVVALSISMFLLTLAIEIALNFRPLYSFDVDYLNITSEVPMPKEKILKNYDILINYLKPFNSTELNFPDFPMSEEGRIHFIDVKNLFNLAFYISLASLVLSVFGIIYLMRIKEPHFLKYASFLLLLLPAILSVPFIINFDKTFDRFHELFFSNNYWIFDPDKDPIINVLPQEFFFHSATLILILLVIFSSALIIVYKSYKKRLADA